MSKRKVLAVTGIRSEYDILYPVLRSLEESGEFELKVVVAGAHLSDWHGFTMSRITADGFKIAEKIDYLLMTNRKTQRIKGIGMLAYALAQVVERESPDFLLVVGDREESIATAMVGNYMDVLVAHIGGGDPVYGNADDPVRFAVSKLAHVHFAFSEAHSRNLKAIGEEEFRIFSAGNPAIDNIIKTPVLALGEISAHLKFDLEDSRYIVFIKHPLSSELLDAHSQMETALQGVSEFCAENRVKAVGIYPNTDPGSYDILRVIEKYAGSKHVRFYKTLPREIFVNLLRNSLALAGNSSLGFLEAPFYKLPVVNIGNRQRGRINAGNVEFVPYDIGAIKTGLRKACFDRKYRTYVSSLMSPAGDGSASEKISGALASISPDDRRWHVKTRLC